MRSQLMLLLVALLEVLFILGCGRPSARLPSDIPNPKQDYKGAIQEWMADGKQVRGESGRVLDLEEDPGKILKVSVQGWVTYQFWSYRPEDVETLPKEVDSGFASICDQAGGHVATRCEGCPFDMSYLTVCQDESRTPLFAMTAGWTGYGRTGSRASGGYFRVTHFTGSRVAEAIKRERAHRDRLAQQNAEQLELAKNTRSFSAAPATFRDPNLVLTLEQVACASEIPVFYYRLANTSSKYMKVHAVSVRLDGVITTFKWNVQVEIPPDGNIRGEPIGLQRPSASVPCGQERNATSVLLGVSSSYVVDGAEHTLNQEQQVQLNR